MAWLIIAIVVLVLAAAAIDVRDKLAGRHLKESGRMVTERRERHRAVRSIAMRGAPVARELDKPIDKRTLKRHDGD
jgi:hypothetical protein